MSQFSIVPSCKRIILLKIWNLSVKENPPNLQPQKTYIYIVFTQPNTIYMKKILLSVICGLSSFSLLAQHTPSLSVNTRYYLHQLNQHPNQYFQEGYAYREVTTGSWYIAAMIKINPSARTIEEDLRNMGVLIGTRAGNIWTVQIPVHKIQDFVKTSGIAYIELDAPVYPAMDQARKTTRVDTVHMGYNLPTPFTGKDVLMGIIDFGFDYNHPAFYDTTGSRYRVQRVWELGTQGTPPVGYSYGHERTDTLDIKAAGTDNPDQMHGTAVAGIAAGSGYGSVPVSSRFRGIAYESDMVLVGVRRDTIGAQWMQGSFSDFVDGVNYIFTQADALGKPAVVNISWGSQSGPHDGTTLFNQACNNLSGPGKVIVMSAGNEGQERIHLSKNFTATDTLLRTGLVFTPDNYQRTWVDIWGEEGETFCAQLSLYSAGTEGSSTGFICLDNQVHDTYLLANNGTDTCYISFITSSAEFINNKPRITMVIYNKTGELPCVAVKANQGSVHLWNEYYYYGYTFTYQSEFVGTGIPGANTGNSNSTASDMGAAESVLLVGAYASKVTFEDINGVTRSYSGYVTAGARVPFSSRGPLADGRIKPDIAAPGLTLCAATTSYDTSYTPTGSNSDLTISSCTHLGKTYYYAEFIGTSASAPVASGIVALMLEANPSLTPEEVKEIITTTAIRDNFTGNIPPQGNNNWGYGKINAYGAIQKVLEGMGVYTFVGEKLDCMLFPNPGKGGFTLDFQGTKLETVSIEIWNLNGLKVFSDTWKVNQGYNRRNLSLAHLAPGNYIVQILSPRGSTQIKATLQP